MIVYVVVMCRWGDDENHSYVSSVHTTLRAALVEGLDHMEHRSNKYEPMIYSEYVDMRRAGRIMCENGEQARKLLYDIDNPVQETNDK